MRLKRILALISATLLSASSLVVLLPSIAHAALPVPTLYWVGGGSDDNFTTAGNWNTAADGSGSSRAPIAHDILGFAAEPASGHTALTNDSGLTFDGLLTTEVPSSATRSYDIDTLTMNTGSQMVVGVPSDCSHHSLSMVVDTINSTGSITLDGVQPSVMTITGNLTTTGQSLDLDTGSHIDGNVTVIAPTQTSGCSGGQGGAPSETFAGFTMHHLYVQKGASVFLGNATYPIDFGGGAASANPIAYFPASYDNDGNYQAVTYTLSGAITLSSDADFSMESLVTTKITGSISGAGHTINYAATSQGVLDNSASSDDSDTHEGTQEREATTTTLSDSQPAGSVIVNSKETTVLDGTRDSITVLPGGILKGTGTANTVYVENQGVLSPGHSPGKMTVVQTLTLTPSSTYQVELKTKNDGDFDQMVVGTSADTTGNDVVLGNATLSVSLFTGYSIAKGDTFKIIDNLSGTPVSGTFNNLAEGATFTSGDGATFSISYVGGDGNDVVLTAINIPAAPNTGFSISHASPFLALAASMFAAGALLVASRQKLLSGK